MINVKYEVQTPASHHMKSIGSRRTTNNHRPLPHRPSPSFTVYPLRTFTARPQAPILRALPR
jgi:hypothetical protein